MKEGIALTLRVIEVKDKKWVKNLVYSWLYDDKKLTSPFFAAGRTH